MTEGDSLAHLLKVKTTKPIPATVEFITKNGDRTVIDLFGSNAMEVCAISVDNCGTRFTPESRKWYVQYRGSTGRWRRVAGYADKEATAQLAANLERKAERLQSGLGDPHEDGKAKSLGEHAEAFRRNLESKANSEKHVNHTCRRVERVLEGCRFNSWADISNSCLLGWLADERAARSFGIKTSNHYLAAMKEFCQWMV